MLKNKFVIKNNRVYLNGEEVHGVQSYTVKADVEDSGLVFVTLKFMVEASSKMICYGGANDVANDIKERL